MIMKNIEIHRFEPTTQQIRQDCCISVPYATYLGTISLSGTTLKVWRFNASFSSGGIKLPRDSIAFGPEIAMAGISDCADEIIAIPPPSECPVSITPS